MTAKEVFSGHFFAAFWRDEFVNNEIVAVVTEE